jgi:carboxyl-terminal processing protease
MKKIILLIALCLFLGQSAQAENTTTIAPFFPIKTKQPFPESGQSFDQVKELLLNNYYSADLTEEALYLAAVQGMLRFVSPPGNPGLAKIWSPSEYRTIRDRLQGESVSLGIKTTFNPNDGSLTVTDIMENSPAAGILEIYDRILRIGDTSLRGKDISALNKMLDGPEGEKINLTINRDIKVFEVTLVRRRFDMRELIVNQLADGILLVEIKKISTNISARLKEELEKYPLATLSGIVLDLRDNPGGLLQEGLRTAEIFLAAKSIILRTVEQKNGLKNYISSNEDPVELPMTVLINGKTSSAAEVIAAALQEHGRALLVGTRTYGKGIAETTYPLANGYHVKFITNAMYSPRGKAWQDKGILPDFFVNQENMTVEDLRKLNMNNRLRRDVPLITALKLLKRQ